MTMPGNIKARLKASAPLLSVGIVSADIMRLSEAESQLAACNIKLLHFDVMDGNFCPQLTAGPFFVKGIATRLLKDVHLMVNDPTAFIPDFVKAGADMITIHAESGRHVHRALQMIAGFENVNEPSRGILRGIALNPGTPVTSIEPFIDETDIVSLLAVNPGFPGGFIESTVRRADELMRLVARMGANPLICIDGGITAETIGKASATGADIIVSGSAVFRQNAIVSNIALLEGNMRKRG